MKKNRAAKVVKMYVTKKQIQFLSVMVAFRVWIGGRGSGKSTAIAYSVMSKVQKMPGSAGLLTCITIEQLKTNTLSSIQKIWKRHNFKEHNVDNPKGKYILFRRPPQSWINKSVAPPTDFKNIIYFFNGTWCKVVSLKVYNAARGGSYDWAEIDEAAFYPEKFYSEILDASIRGNRNGRRNNNNENIWDMTEHHQVSFYSSMPYLNAGKWVLKFEALAKSDPDGFYYQESTVYDNIKVYGREKLERSKKLLSWFKFQVEYMNMRINRATNGYYHAFREEKHIYGDNDPYDDISVLDFYYNPRKPLTLSFDFGGHYSPMGVFQEYRNTEYQLNHFDAKERESLKDLCIKFDNAYRGTQVLKTVHVYGDPRGLDASEHGLNSYEFITKYLVQLGWKVIICVQNHVSESHESRYLAMNNILLEDDDTLPRIRFHRERCKDSIIAMQLTEAKDNFQKDKKTERDKKFPQQHAAHNTDLVDYLITQKYGSRWRVTRSILPNAVSF